jgi:hypothetical protein
VRGVGCESLRGRHGQTSPPAAHPSAAGIRTQN